jgi:hypothetical protein
MFSLDIYVRAYLYEDTLRQLVRKLRLLLVKSVRAYRAKDFIAQIACHSA